MPMAGLGLCCRPSAHGDAVKQSVVDFLMLGGRHLDDAEVYGNHREVGEGIRQAVAQGVPRKEIFFVTKINPDNFGFEKALRWVPEMLGELGLDHVDLVLLHWAGFEGRNEEFCGTARQCRLETWLALQRFWQTGQIRNLGVSNFGERQIQEIMALKGAPVAVNQIEYHPWVPAEYRKALEFCHANKIAVTAYASMGSERGAQQLTREPSFQELGSVHQKTAGQVLLRWSVQKNITVIPGTGNPEHMVENLKIFDFQLSAEAMAFLDSMWQGQTFSLYNHYPDNVT